jgi:phosphate transport system substrate-binding protein
MKRFVLIGILVLSVLVIVTACKNSDTNGEADDIEGFRIKGLTFDNYPKMDGSTSVVPLNGLIFCKLFDLDFKWVFGYNILGWSIIPNVGHEDPEWHVL